MAAPAPDLDSISWVRVLIASSTVIALLGLLALGLRYFAARGWTVAPQNCPRRLKIVETLALDTRRRLVIARCDGQEHLLLLGPQSDTVVASNLPPPPSPANP